MLYYSARKASAEKFNPRFCFCENLCFLFFILFIKSIFMLSFDRTSTQTNFRSSETVQVSSVHLMCKRIISYFHTLEFTSGILTIVEFDAGCAARLGPLLPRAQIVPYFQSEAGYSPGPLKPRRANLGYVPPRIGRYGGGGGTT